RQVEALRRRDAAAVTIDDVVAEADRAVVVRGRREGPGAVTVVVQRAVVGRQPGDRQRVAVDIAEAGEQVGGLDRVARVLGACRQRRLRPGQDRSVVGAVDYNSERPDTQRAVRHLYGVFNRIIKDFALTEGLEVQIARVIMDLVVSTD